MERSVMMPALGDVIRCRDGKHAVVFDITTRKDPGHLNVTEVWVRTRLLTDEGKYVTNAKVRSFFAGERFSRFTVVGKRVPVTLFLTPEGKEDLKNIPFT